MGLIRCTFVIVLLVGCNLSIHAAEDAFPANIDLLGDAVQEIVEQALAEMHLPSQADGNPILMMPRNRHDGNWLVEHLLLSGLLERGMPVTLDSTRQDAGMNRLDYRVDDLRVAAQGGLFRGTVSRQAYATIALRLSADDVLHWQKEYAVVVEDRITKGRVDLLKNPRHSFADTDLEVQDLGQFVEPVLVSTVLGGLVYLFFSNR